MLRDVFDAVHAAINLVLQKGNGSLCLSDLAVYLNKTLLELKNVMLKTNECGSTGCSFWRSKRLLKNKRLPPSANLQHFLKFSFEKFCNETYP